MADCKPVRVRDGLDVFVWTGEAGDTGLPLIVDFRQLTVAVTKGAALEGTLDPDVAGRWFPLQDQDGTPTGLRDRLVTVRERVYQVRPVFKDAGEVRLHMGRA